MAYDSEAQGIGSYTTMCVAGTVGGSVAGGGGEIQAHHLIEKRCARVMGANTDDYASIVVTREEHQAFTNAWRNEIPTGQGTRRATQAQVEDAARRNYPEILNALGL
jgi:hypothetical protein